MYLNEMPSNIAMPSSIKKESNAGKKGERSRGEQAQVVMDEGAGGRKEQRPLQREDDCSEEGSEPAALGSKEATDA